MGVTNTIRHFQKDFQDRLLKESTVRTWMNKYKKELAERRRSGSNKLDIKKLPSLKRGHPLLLGEFLDNQVKEYIRSLREAGAVINSAIVMGEGIVKNDDSLCAMGVIFLLLNLGLKVCLIGLVMLNGDLAPRQKLQYPSLKRTSPSFYMMSGLLWKWKRFQKSW